MNKLSFIKGQPVYYQFEPATVDEIDPVRGVRSLKVASGTWSGNFDDEIFAATQDVVEVSCAFAKLYDRVKVAANGLNINWPDIKQELVRLWIQRVRNGVEIHTVIERCAESFVRQLEEELFTLNRQTVHHVKLFR